MRALKILLSLTMSLLIGTSAFAAMPDKEGEDTYSLNFHTVEDCYDSFNVQSYTVLDDEKNNMYDAESILRRDEKTGEAWIVYEIPYLSEFCAESYHLPQDAAEMSFEVSKDGEKWEKLETAVENLSEDGRWTRFVYKAKEIEGVRFLKAVWGTEENLENWWNPYFKGISANVGTPKAKEIAIKTSSFVALPAYDSTEIQFEGEILDQIGEKFEGEIKWEVVSLSDNQPENKDDNNEGVNPPKNDDSDEPEDESEENPLSPLSEEMEEDSDIPTAIEVTSEGKMTLTADMKAGTKFRIRGSFGEISAEKDFILCGAQPGDADGDGVITDSDIDTIILNFGAEVTKDNRLCDADKNGKIDIIDLAYAARYKTYQ